MRVVQAEGERGSLKWIQRAIEEKWPELNEPILDRLPNTRSIEWLSPRREDGFAEYRDGAFLKLLGLGQFANALAEFWPSRGPQWDALGRSDAGDVFLVEAKAHIREFCSPASGASAPSRAKIDIAFERVAGELGARSGASWASIFYQHANRLAHLWFLRDNGVPAWLVLVGFVGDREMGGPTSPEAWDAAYQVADHALGLPARHALSRFIIHVCPKVAA